jgi:hypothetical protein
MIPAQPDSISTSPQNLFVLGRRVGNGLIDQPARPRLKMIILLWATWMLAVVAYLGVVGPH